MEAGDHWPLQARLQFICRLCSAVSLSAALQSAPALSVTITYQSITVSRPLTSNWSFSQPEGRRIIIRLVQRINRFIALVCIESKYYRASSSLRCSSAVLVHQSPVRVDWLVVELAVLVLNRAHDDVPSSAPKSSIRRFVITEKAPTGAFSWLKAPTSAFTFKTLLRHYAKRALTPR